MRQNRIIKMSNFNQLISCFRFKVGSFADRALFFFVPWLEAAQSIKKLSLAACLRFQLLYLHLLPSNQGNDVCHHIKMLQNLLQDNWIKITYSGASLVKWANSFLIMRLRCRSKSIFWVFSVFYLHERIDPLSSRLFCIIPLPVDWNSFYPVKKIWFVDKVSDTTFSQVKSLTFFSRFEVSNEGWSRFPWA